MNDPRPAEMTTAREQRIRTTIPTLAGRALLVTGILGHAGKLELVEIAEGYTDGPKDYGRAAQFPGHVLPLLLEALQALQDPEAEP